LILCFSPGYFAGHVVAVLPGVKYAFILSMKPSADVPALTGSGSDCRRAEKTGTFLAFFFFIAMSGLLFFPAGDA